MSLEAPLPTTIKEVACPPPRRGLLSLEHIARLLSIVAQELIAIRREIGAPRLVAVRAPAQLQDPPVLQPIPDGPTAIPSTPDGASLMAPTTCRGPYWKGGEGPPHGTTARYSSRGCRCAECRAANAAYMRAYREKARGQP